MAFYFIFVALMFVFLGAWAGGAACLFCAITIFFHMRFVNFAEKIVIAQRQEIEKLRDK